MFKTLFVLIMVTSSIFADCKLALENPDVIWTAYKTPAKVGVTGNFKSISMDTKASTEIDNTILGTKILINTDSVYSKNETRDAKLIKFFFKTLASDTIEVKVVNVYNSTILVRLKLNNITKDIPFKYTHKDNYLIANAIVDMKDFDALNAIASINKACFKLHKGKTWSDVKVSFEAKVVKYCK